MIYKGGMSSVFQLKGYKQEKGEFTDSSASLKCSTAVLSVAHTSLRQFQRHCCPVAVVKESKTQTLVFPTCVICKQKQRTGESQSCVETDALTHWSTFGCSQGSSPPLKRVRSNI